ncbi:urease accessory protein [Paenibacillus taihuensis]|uniref:Urease accessory protein UreD n=2 Tax=Paenibacillus taihuensis TaxID=1156355 RepID=A0A3D9RS10_9BACL|nr:urease accessory protein [Paenibacillus taihuensis]
MLPVPGITAASSEKGQRVSQLRAVFEKRERGSMITSKYHTAPIKIAKAFPLGGPIGVIVMDVSPGLLAGDRYELQWKAGEGAHAYITNQSFTKIHPAHEDCGGSAMIQSFELEAGAIVESMPEPTMLYRDAVFTMKTDVHLAEGSVWMGAEVLCPGRALRGELFAYRSYRSKLNVYYKEELIYAQHQMIEPMRQRLTARGCFAEMTHTGVFYVFSDRLQSVHAEAVRAVLSELPPFEEHPIEWGVSVTYKHGIAVMAASTAAWPLQEALSIAWGTVRELLLGMPPIALRK